LTIDDYLWESDLFGDSILSPVENYTTGEDIPNGLKDKMLAT
jgi:hypothetical protein